MNDQISKIRGESGTDVTLTMQRDDADPFDVTITRAEIKVQEVETRLIDGHVGYIALHGFSSPAAEQFKAGLQELLDQGADQIVFDLRDNPGGYIDAAQKIASQFIGDGLIFTQESAGGDVKEYPSTGDGIATNTDLPVAVLINGGSASASEIVAAALQGARPRGDRRRAELREEHGPGLGAPREPGRCPDHDQPLVHSRPQQRRAGRHPARHPRRAHRRHATPGRPGARRGARLPGRPARRRARASRSPSHRARRRPRSQKATVVGVVALKPIC